MHQNLMIKADKKVILFCTQGCNYMMMEILNVPCFSVANLIVADIQLHTLQVFLPTVFRAATMLVSLIYTRLTSNMVFSAYLIIMSWQNTAHPLFCFIYIKPLRVTFYDFFVKFFCCLKLNSKVKPLKLNVSVSQMHVLSTK